MIDHFVAKIFQHGEGDIFRKVVDMTNMAVGAAKAKQGMRTQQRANRKIQGKLDHFIFTLRFYSPQKTETVLYMLNHIYQQNEVKKSILLTEVRQLEVQSLTLSLFGKRESL